MYKTIKKVGAIMADKFGQFFKDTLKRNSRRTCKRIKKSI